MNMKDVKVLLCIGLFLLFALIASLTTAGASVTELDVKPSIVLPGEMLSISGMAKPNEVVSLKSSFEMSLPVSNGKYSEEFNGIHFPAGEKRFSVIAKNVKDIRVSLGPIFFMTFDYPLDGPKKATKGVATLSISLPISGIDVAGEKNVRVYGAALDDASAVILTTDMAIKVPADNNGDFKLELDTEGVPIGEFSITAGETEETVQIGTTKPKPTLTPGPSHDEDKEIVSSPTITPTICPTTPLSGLKTSTGPTSSPGQKQTQTPEPTQVQRQMQMPDSTSVQKQKATSEPSPGHSQRLIPGFGAFFAIAGLITVAFLLLTLRRK